MPLEGQGSSCSAFTLQPELHAGRLLTFLIFQAHVRLSKGPTTHSARHPTSSLLMGWALTAHERTFTHSSQPLAFSVGWL